MAVLGAACAQSVEPANDGQTHWMQRCDSDAECGSLACVCGVCTETCSSDEDACVVGDDAVCARSSEALGDGACRSDAVHLCAPACERQADCDAIGDGLTCSGNALCALEEAVGPGPEAPDSGMQGDAGEDAGEQDSGSIGLPTYNVACQDDGTLEGTGVEVIASATFIESFVIAPDGVIYALYEDESGTRGQGLLRIDGSGEPEPIARSVYNIVELVMHGPELFVVINDNGYEARIAHIDLLTEEVTFLAREEALNPRGIAFDPSWVFWSAQVSQEPDPELQLTRVWRSRRERDPVSETELLAEIPGDAPDLVFVDGALYVYSGITAEDAQLYRIATDGSGAEVVDTGNSFGKMFTDGTTLWVARGGGVDDLGNNLNNVRIAGVDLETFNDANGVGYPAGGEGTLVEVALSEDEIFWVMDANREAEGGHATQSVWRASKDGEIPPGPVADVIGWAQPIAEHEGYLYWIAGCRLQLQKHLVRVDLF